MTNFVIEIAGTAVGLLGVFIAIWMLRQQIAARLIEVIVSKSMEEEGNRRSTQIEAALQLHRELLTTGIEHGHRSEDELRSRRIEAIRELWEEVLRIRKEFSDVVALEAVLTNQELNELARKKELWTGTRGAIVSAYDSSDKVISKIAASDAQLSDGDRFAIALGTKPDRIEGVRPFISDTLWAKYRAVTGIQARLGHLFSMGIQEKKKIDWKADHRIREMAIEAAPDGTWEHLEGQRVSAFRVLVIVLEQEILEEAKRIIHGQGEFARTIKDIRDTVDSEYAQLSQLREEFLNQGR